ncbi:MAG: T9SS type A sorting domain-containing protein [Flavobacteriales bacterium]|nr:T9SS type A sorting domain-containing protein [Flavobacteriales bacterium]
MRHLTLSLLILSSASTIGAQDYLGNDPLWLVGSICAVPAPCIANDFYNYYTVGDSVIDNVTWTKVAREGVVTYMWQASPPVGPGCQGMHSYGPAEHGVQLIRQEGRSLRIWVDDADQLLFDFDLTLGQTLPLTWNNWNTDITVIAVDSVLIGTEMRARFELGNSWAQYLIEGVGSSNGLFEPISNFFDCGYGLDCFGLGSQSYYPTNWTGGCLVTMGLNDIKGNEAITVAPNPATDRVRISGIQAGDALTLHDGFGRVVLQVRSNSTKTDLDVSDLPTGVYTVAIGDRRERLVVVR